MDGLGRVRLTGKGFNIDLSQYFSPERIKQILAELKSAGTPHAKDEYLKKLFAEIPDAAKSCFGFCQSLKKHVKHEECVECSKTKGFKNIPEWETCISTNIRR